jgi:hypothetical protein
MTHDRARGLVPGLAYQLGIPFASPVNSTELRAARPDRLGRALAVFETATILSLGTLVLLDSEERGRHFVSETVAGLMPRRLAPFLATGRRRPAPESRPGRRSQGNTVKFVALVAVPPPGVVTAILPLVAPEGTVAVILMELLMVKFAATPLNVTEFALRKVVPLMITWVPGDPEVGEKLVMVGGTTKVPTLAAVPAVLVTLILPVVAAEGTLTVIFVGELIVKAVVEAALKATALAVSKLVPVMTTVVPGTPLPGVNPVIVGGRMTMKLVALVAVPAGVVTVILPVVVPAETLAVS